MKVGREVFGTTQEKTQLGKERERHIEGKKLISKEGGRCVDCIEMRRHIMRSLFFCFSLSHTDTLTSKQRGLFMALSLNAKRPMSTAIQDLTCKEQLQGECQKMKLL